jgi:hypothetical protein
MQAHFPLPTQSQSLQLKLEQDPLKRKAHTTPNTPLVSPRGTGLNDTSPSSSTQSSARSNEYPMYSQNQPKRSGREALKMLEESRTKEAIEQMRRGEKMEPAGPETFTAPSSTSNSSGSNPISVSSVPAPVLSSPPSPTSAGDRSHVHATVQLVRRYDSRSLFI